MAAALIAFEFLPPLSLPEDATAEIRRKFGFDGIVSQLIGSLSVTGDLARLQCDVVLPMAGDGLYCVPTSHGPVYVNIKEGGNIFPPLIIPAEANGAEPVSSFDHLTAVLPAGVVASYLYAQQYVGPDKTVILEITKQGSDLCVQLMGYTLSDGEVARLANITGGEPGLFYEFLGQGGFLAASSPRNAAVFAANRGGDTVLTPGPGGALRCVAAARFKDEECRGISADALKALQYLQGWGEPA
jgi:hypothetical protein